jgi:hypothetical protein
MDSLSRPWPALGRHARHSDFELPKDREVSLALYPSGHGLPEKVPPNNDPVAGADLRYREPAALATVHILLDVARLVQDSGIFCFPDFPLTAHAAASNSRNVEEDYGRNARLRQARGGRMLRWARGDVPGKAPGNGLPHVFRRRAVPPARGVRRRG